ncbi:GIY-YIG nuclease family protein [Halovenus marina]|uniref:GIY-YIG nuclease family protein n=1 Tax=Halovenus marina TaxID=3396621 RepID=UPI003F578D07
MSQYVYIVECADESLYTGYTTDVGRRVREHDAGNGAKYTAGRRPVTLRYVEYHPSKGAAMRREHEIKSLTRTQKERLLPDESDRIGVAFSEQSQRA